MSQDPPLGICCAELVGLGQLGDYFDRLIGALLQTLPMFSSVIRQVRPAVSFRGLRAVPRFTRWRRGLVTDNALVMKT
jgi:hypothetical protein